MDEFTADAFANRDEPVPLLIVPGSDDDISISASDTESVASSASRSSRLRRAVSPSRWKEQAQERQAERVEEGKLSLQDRLFSKLLGQVIPSEALEDDVGHDTTARDRRSSKLVTRPAFSLPLMTNNFRRFNARIGIVFVFQNRMIRLFTWRHPTHTISFLATYTFICLDPYLLAVLPLAVIVLFIMVPAFLSRHPPPPPQAHTSATTPYYSTYAGPAIAPARTIKPAAETSKDFFRNMRDLQNSMADFSNIHDTLVALIAPATNFSDEILSSTIFLYLFFLTLSLFIISHLLPWRLIALTAGYTLTISGHPTVQTWLMKHQKSLLSSTTTTTTKPRKSPNSQPKVPALLNLPLPTPPASLHPLITSLSTITISSSPETREVEIFELQHRPLIPSTSSTTNALEWTPHLFTPTPYDPLSPSRIAGDRPRGTRFFEDVQPPKGWEWHGKKWELDLDAGEWVNERLVVGVEYGVVASSTATTTTQADNDGDKVKDKEKDKRASVGSTTGGTRNSLQRSSSESGEFGGWVWDLPPPPGAGGRDEEVWLAYGDYDVPAAVREKEKKAAKKKQQQDKQNKEKDWEEAVRYGGGSSLRTGEWRRRRWVRVVRRKPELGSGTKG